jgi:diguanylate cyclase (GGDEF)-like protein
MMKAKTLSEVAAELGKTDLFSSFDPADLAYLAEHTEIRFYSEGEAVFSNGDQADCLFVVASGSVSILVGEEAKTVMAEYVEGDSFGELEFLTGGQRNALAQAGAGTQLIAFPPSGQSLESALQARPSVAARIMRSFLIVTSRRTRKANALIKENSPWIREMRRQAYTDKLTGLKNKAFLEESLPALLSPGGKPVFLLMLKPDNFKEINDSYGHEAGDATLALMAAEFERCLGQDGSAIRYMGNELASILEAGDRQAALAVAERVGDALRGLDLSAAIGDGGTRLSVSIGLASYPSHASSADELIKVASGLPLVGRSKGGNLVVFPEDAP